jgi:hypothetical protein
MVARRAAAHACAPRQTLFLDDLAALLVAALFAGCASQLAAYVDARTLLPWIAVAAGLALGFLAAPCALGAVAIGAALHARSPQASAAFLCVAGIVDVRALFGRRAERANADATAYLTLAIGLTLVAIRHGDALVRPAIAPLLASCAVIAFACAVRNRGAREPKARWAPAIMLAGALVTAPPPAYTATETTLGDIFAGERLDFTGRLTRNGSSAALVRYAITCCRADAAPVVVRLREAPRLPVGTWVRASGSVAEIRLSTTHLEAVAPPADPFIYR